MQRKFIVQYVRQSYYASYQENVVLEDSESAICGYVSWALLHSPALSVMLIQSDEDGGRVVAVAEKKVQITLKQQDAADITKLI